MIKQFISAFVISSLLSAQVLGVVEGAQLVLFRDGTSASEKDRIMARLGGKLVGSAGAAWEQSPVITQAGNEVPVVLIAPPSLSGVSVNEWGSFNVGREGIIFNNATNEYVETKLGGVIRGNERLQGVGSAKVIVNEVKGGQLSAINGYMEVAGQKADLVVVNEAGISVSGGGVINTRSLTLSTGKTRYGTDWKVEGWDVSRGEVRIDQGPGGVGLNGLGLVGENERVDILARAVKMNGAVWSEYLNVVGGVNEVKTTLTTGKGHGQAGLEITSKAGDSNKPLVWLDVSEIADVRAGSMYLIGTEAGVGVNQAGRVVAGELKLESNGDMIWYEID